MPLRLAHVDHFHLEEDRYFADVGQCREWLVTGAIRANADLIAINGHLTAD